MLVTIMNRRFRSALFTVVTLTLLHQSAYAEETGSKSTVKLYCLPAEVELTAIDMAVTLFPDMMAFVEANLGPSQIAYSATFMHTQKTHTLSIFDDGPSETEGFRINRRTGEAILTRSPAHHVFRCEPDGGTLF